MDETKNQTVIKLEIGDLAPNFVNVSAKPESLVEEIELYKILKEGEKVLLVFYPGDDTPGCTKQLCEIRDIYSEYQKLGVRVIGINHGNQKSHHKFIDKYSFPFEIVIDENKEIRESYGATKPFFKNITTKRGVFLIDTDKKILFIHWGQQDNEKIINFLKNS
jgi:peroxiredoxin Q/BCP